MSNLTLIELRRDAVDTVEVCAGCCTNSERMASCNHMVPYGVFRNDPKAGLVRRIDVYGDPEVVWLESEPEGE